MKLLYEKKKEKNLLMSPETYVHQSETGGEKATQLPFHSLRNKAEDKLNNN